MYKFFNKIEIAFKYIVHTLGNLISDADVFYIVENADWSIKDDGLSIKKFSELKIRVTISHLGIKKSIVHYGSINTFLTRKGCKACHSSNRVIVTWFHVTPDDERNNDVVNYQDFVDFFHTSCSLTKEKLMKLGLSNSKIKMIPLGVDINLFSPKTKAQDTASLKVGSFQKDGEGWGEGNKPKFVKGPDIFLRAIGLLKNLKPEIEVVLTGPSRGFVKKGLEDLDVKYSHVFLEKPSQVSSYYKEIDYYFVCSREEGGPKAILESMASGVPIISTKVGMAPDIIVDGKNGFIVDKESDYVKIVQLLEKNQLEKEKIIANARITSEKYSWLNISKRYKEELYFEKV